MSDDPVPQAAGPQATPGSTLSDADIAFLMDGKYSVRHVSSRAHMDRQLAVVGTGDAFPLSDMVKDVVDDMASKGEVPARRSMSSAEMMEKYGDVIRPRVQRELEALV